MAYWSAHVYTPFCGEDADVYIQANNRAEAESKAADAAMENGMEWLDEKDWIEQHNGDEDSLDDYYAQCGVQYMSTISKDEYDYRNEQGEWCI